MNTILENPDYLLPADHSGDLSDFQTGSMHSFADERGRAAFWKEYCVATLEEDVLWVGEPVPAEGQLVIEARPRFYGEEEDKGKPIREDILVILVTEAQNIVAACMTKSSSLDCLILTTEGGYNVDGFVEKCVRLIFPHIGATKQTSQAMARELGDRMEKSTEARPYVRLMGNTWSDALADSLLSASLPLIGSRSSQKELPVYLSAFWGDIRECDSPSPPQKDIASLSGRFKGNSDHWLPLICSLSHKVAINVRAPEALKLRLPSAGCGPEELSSYFMKLINPERLRTRHYWRDIGTALSTAFSGSSAGLEIFVEYSEKHSERRREDCDMWYRTRRPDVSYTHHTLAWYASVDNPVAFQEWRDVWVEESVSDLHKKTSNISRAHSTVAEIFYRAFCYLKYARGETLAEYRGSKRPETYFFTGQRWVRQRKAASLEHKLMKEFPNYLSRLGRDLSLRQEKADGDERDALREKKQMLGLLEGVLSDRNMRGNILQDVHTLISHETGDAFAEYRDRNGNLFACGNHVLEMIMSTGEVLARDGKPEDYITLGTDIEYHAEWTKDAAAPKAYMEFLRKVFVEEDLIHFVMKIDSGELLSFNPDKKIVWNVGVKGHNAKTTRAEINEKLFGDYCGDCPCTTFSSRFDETRATPQLARNRYAKIVQISEYSHTIQYDSARLKRHSGNDRTESRFMHDNGAAIRPHYKLRWFGNVLPTFHSPDKSTMERNIFIPHNTQFLFADDDEKVPETEEERWEKRIFLVDPTLDSRKYELAEASLWWRVHYFPIYAKERLGKLPRAVKELKKEYWKKYDTFNLFITQNLVEGEGQEVSARALYDTYTKWFTSLFRGFDMAMYTNFEAEMTRRLGKSQGSSWKGWGLSDENAGPQYFAM